MPSDESFLLVSLDDEKSKELAQVINSKTCRKILDFLAKKEATESEISKKLKIPLSTVHYNLQQLTKAKLVVVEEFHYSQKGKEVNHYKLANKYIIIAPQQDKKSSKIKDALKKIIPIGIVSVGIAGILQVFQKAATPMMAKGSTEVMLTVAEDAAPRVMDAAVQTAPPSASTGLPFAVWFLFGALFVILVMLLIEIFRKK
jgi:DNA-binding transcriptional ArsR family regulator